jgi:hypothetical protein
MLRKQDPLDKRKTHVGVYPVVNFCFPELRIAAKIIEQLLLQMPAGRFFDCAALRRHGLLLRLTIRPGPASLRVRREVLDLRSVFAYPTLVWVCVRLHRRAPVSLPKLLADTGLLRIIRQAVRPHVFAKVGPGELRIRFRKIIVRLVADELTRVGNIEALEAVVA